jgi:hypothetical protein
MPEGFAALPQDRHIEVNLTIGCAITMNGVAAMIGQTHPTINPYV